LEHRSPKAVLVAEEPVELAEQAPAPEPEPEEVHRERVAPPVAALQVLVVRSIPIAAARVPEALPRPGI